MTEQTSAAPVATEAPASNPADTSSAAPSPAAAAQTPDPSPPSGQAAPAAAPSGTIAAGDVSAAPLAPQPNWPDDWRQKLAGEDKGYLKTLERFATPADLAKAYRELQKTRGQQQPAATVPPADATPEDIAHWRKENGIPEAADKYDTDLGKGFVWGEADKPFLQSFTEFAHSRHMKPDQVKANLEWYAAQQERAQEIQFQADTDFKTKAEDALRQEWGQDYRRNVTAVSNLLSGFDGADDLRTARTPDGRVLGNDPGFMRWLNKLALDINPVASVLPNSGANPAKALADRMAEIKGMMGDRNSAYWKGPQAVSLQNEYKELVVAAENLKARAA